MGLPVGVCLRNSASSREFAHIKRNSAEQLQRLPKMYSPPHLLHTDSQRNVRCNTLGLGLPCGCRAAIPKLSDTETEVTQPQDSLETVRAGTATHILKLKFTTLPQPRSTSTSVPLSCACDSRCGENYFYLKNGCRYKKAFDGGKHSTERSENGLPRGLASTG